MQHLGTTYYTSKDKEKAKVYWKKVFSSHRRQLPALSPDCQISIIVPVFGERIDRIKDQLRFFKLQTLSPDVFEIIYIINNDLPQGTPEWKESFTQNQLVLTFLRAYKGLNVRVIDRSSRGLEIKECNVGKARNVGVAEVSVRYFEQSRDGILFQTDADARLNNKNHLRRILSAFRKDPLCFGASGGVLYELSLDTESAKIQKEYEKLFSDIVLYFRWYALVDAYKKDRLTLPGHSRSFSGVHMVSRALASACIGGMQELGIAEDVLFGEDLCKFAKKHGGDVLPMRDKWYAVTAFRESSRTDSSFGKVFERILKEGGVYAPSPHSPSFRTFADGFLVKIARAQTLTDVRKLIFDFTKPYRFSDADVQSFWKAVQSSRGKGGRYAAYTAWRKQPENKDKKIVGDVHSKYFPRIRVTRHVYNQLKKIVYTNAHKREYVEYFKKHYQNFRRKR